MTTVRKDFLVYLSPERCPLSWHAKNMLDIQAPKLSHLAPAIMFLPSFFGADGVGIARIFSMMQNQVLGFDGFPLL